MLSLDGKLFIAPTNLSVSRNTLELNPSFSSIIVISLFSETIVVSGFLPVK